jgi:hypothetical protein
VRDACGQQLAYVYYESEPSRRSAAKLLSKDEARRVAANVAKLPELPETTLVERVVMAAHFHPQLSELANMIEGGAVPSPPEWLRNMPTAASAADRGFGRNRLKSVLLPSSVLRWIEQEAQGAAGSLGGATVRGPPIKSTKL